MLGAACTARQSAPRNATQMCQAFRQYGSCKRGAAPRPCSCGSAAGRRTATGARYVGPTAALWEDELHRTGRCAVGRTALAVAPWGMPVDPAAPCRLRESTQHCTACRQELHVRAQRRRAAKPGHAIGVLHARCVCPAGRAWMLRIDRPNPANHAHALCAPTCCGVCCRRQVRWMRRWAATWRFEGVVHLPCPAHTIKPYPPAPYLARLSAGGPAAWPALSCGR